MINKHQRLLVTVKIETCPARTKTFIVMKRWGAAPLNRDAIYSDNIAEPKFFGYGAATPYRNIPIKKDGLHRPLTFILLFNLRKTCSSN
jgi:hypothetical protein